MDSIIACENLQRVYTSKSILGKKTITHALTGLNLTIPKGIVMGLLGPNGSGKTTTVRILSTLLTPTSGVATVAGFNVVKQADNVRKKIGLILGGDKGFYGRLTGAENLRYFAALNGIRPARSNEKITAVLDTIGLSDAADRPVEQYSRGMKQRLHIGRGLITDPDILFLDEPTIGIDPAGARELRELIPVLKAEGKTVLLTTHYMSEADELSDSIAIIDKGQIIATGTPSEIKRKFSKIAVLEIICKRCPADVADKLNSISDVLRVMVSEDGPLNRVTIHTHPDATIEDAARAVIGEDLVESAIYRDPTLEEAYLSIIE